MVIKLQSILSPDFNHGVMVLECFLKMRPKRNRRHMAGSRHTNFWSDQTRPDQQPHHQTAVARLVTIEDPWAEGEEGHHSVEFLSGPIFLSHATRHGRELHSRPRNEFRNELLCIKKISPDFWQTIDYLLCTAWNTTNFRHYHQCACCTRTDCSTHGLT
jgi:hypothetical protein